MMIGFRYYIGYSLCALLILAVTQSALATMQHTYITGNNNREFNIGPQTTPVILEKYIENRFRMTVHYEVRWGEEKPEGYIERNQYHELRYVSKTKGVDREGDGSKENPWTTIQHALMQIVDASRAKSYAILVAEGIYSESTIQLKEYISLYGGFESSSWDRDIEKYNTILDGEGRERILVGADYAKVDGFTLKRGVVRGPGGAILCDGVSPVISNNVFTENKTLAPVPWDPLFWHEIAHDGAAIAVINGASPVVKHNLFFKNSTEIGRGGGIACHNRAAPEIAYNIFIDNVTGTIDPGRSSDGGAISVYRHSDPVIRNNIVLGNEAISRNDGGGIYSALWSSPVIDGNLIIGNYSENNGGGLYLSGQRYHYITIPDPVPAAENFLVRVRNNIIMGNSTSLKEDAVDGILQFLNDCRMIFENNLIVENVGGVNFHRSYVTAKHNTFIADVFIQDSERAPVLFSTNLVIGELGDESGIILKESIVLDKNADDPLYPELFIDDSKSIGILEVSFHEDRYVSVIQLDDTVMVPDELIYRVVKSGDCWGVVKHNDESSVTVWGNFVGERTLTVLPTYTYNKSSDIYELGIGYRH
jgi:hypothetical protein